MSLRLARLLSIIGHPLLVLPFAALLLINARHAKAAQTFSIAACFAAVALGVMLYSQWQVRRGCWQHIDASHPSERATLNRFLLLLLTSGALLAWWRAQPELALGLGLSAVLILAALLLSRWCELSLHVACAVYAAGLLSPLGLPAMATTTLFATALGWSRWRLGRHTPSDLVVAAIAGASAAWLYVQWKMMEASVTGVMLSGVML